jgi:hypothetical protein
MGISVFGKLVAKLQGKTENYELDVETEFYS